MKYDLIIVRYGEIGLKAKVTRRQFENTLVNNIKKAFETKKISNEIKLKRGRIFVHTKQIKDSLKILEKIFGIASFSPALKADSSIKSMENLAAKISKKQMEKTDSFALKVTREGNHEYTSQDIAVKVGDAVRKSTKAKVNLSKPDFTLFIEIRDKDAYFFIDKMKGVGGLPLSTQGNALAFIDSNQSILASWYMMHRGCKVIYATNDEKFNKKIENFNNRWHSKSKIFTMKQDKEFFKNINKLSKDFKCEAVVTGHTINDMEDIKKFKSQVDYLVLHPLVAMSKKQIKNKMNKVGLIK